MGSIYLSDEGNNQRVNGFPEGKKSKSQSWELKILISSSLRDSDSVGEIQGIQAPW